MTEPLMTRPAAALVSVRWERIQVTVRLTPTVPGSIQPSALRLQFASDPGQWLAPARAWTTNGDVSARFNVMLGPGKVPLVPGSWRLVADPPGGAATPISVTPPAAGALESAEFATVRGMYDVETRIAGEQLAFEIRLDRPAPREIVRRPSRSTLGEIRRKLALGLLNVLYRLARLVSRRDPKRILFVGHYGTDLSGDMQAVLARMAERGLDREHVIRKVPPLRRRTDRTWLRLPWELARAETVVIEEDVLYMFPTDGLRVIQLWHASGALKAIGYSRIGKLAARSPWSSHYKYFTWAIVSGEHDVPLFAEAFGMPEERVLPLGHPRMDRFFDPAWREQARAATLAAFPMAKGRRVILFAPTWRSQGLARVYDLSVLDYPRLYELLVAIDAVFIIRLHPTVIHPVDIPAAYADRIVNGTTSVMDAPEQLCATDLLITDYSSIILEYALLGRPMLFFAPDLDEYRADRDVYMPYEEFVPGRIVETFDDLLTAIQADDYQVEKVEPFARSQFTYMDGGATDRVVDLILGMSDTLRYHSAPATAPGVIGVPHPEQEPPSE